MRTRIGGLLAAASLLIVAASSCSTAGVSFVYMAIDQGGLQHRQTFYTDTTNIYCIAKVSNSNPDTTIDFIVSQNTVKPWCNPNTSDSTDTHPDFANGEQTVSVGTETVVAGQLLQTGAQVAATCTGYCTQNVPTGNLCTLAPGQMTAGTCRPTYESLGVDSCGIGLTCCESLVPNSQATGMPLTDVPYPAGTYTCTVELNGVVAGSTDFTIDYPPNDCPVVDPVSGIPCYDWVPRGAHCAGNANGTTCTCLATGVWGCQ